MQRKYKFKVAPEHIGYPGIEYLQLQMPNFALKTLKKMFYKGLVKINGSAAKPDIRLKVGENIRIVLPEDVTVFPSVPLTLDIPFENDDFLVVNKPAGIPVIGERWTRQEFFKDAIVEHYKKTKQSCQVRIVHRIDKETSGLVVVAKSQKMEKYLCKLFENRKIYKEYHAIVAGVPEDKGTIDLKIAQASKRSNRMIISEFGKKAVTHYEVQDTFGDFALLKVMIETGRTHQIRVHMASQGFPLAIDSIYGYRTSISLSEIKSNYVPKKRRLEKPLMSRLTLHSARLSFSLPDGTPFDVEAPMPEDMQRLLKMLQKYRPKTAIPKGL